MNNIQSQLKLYIKEKKAVVDRCLDTLLPRSAKAPRLVQAMGHSLNAGGKRLRPILCVAAFEALRGPAPEDIVSAACALELVHTYSLIHDDLPAMDDDRLRRGQPTCHIAYDEATAILAGDALLTLAFQVLAQTSQASPVDAGIWIRVAGVLADAAGFRGMVEGQMQDMLAEGQRLSLDELEALHRLKTGALIEAAVTMGCLLARADRGDLGRLQRYARRIGLAFQVSDDILNVTGDPERLGKAVGTDAQRGKNTYPGLLGLDGAQRLARRLIEEAIASLADLDDRAQPLRSLAHYIIQRHR